MGTDTCGVIRDSSSMSLYRWWLFFLYVTVIRTLGTDLMFFTGSPSPPIERISLPDTMSTFSLIPQHYFP